MLKSKKEALLESILSIFDDPLVVVEMEDDYVHDADSYKNTIEHSKQREPGEPKESVDIMEDLKNKMGNMLLRFSSFKGHFEQGVDKEKYTGYARYDHEAKGELRIGFELGKNKKSWKIMEDFIPYDKEMSAIHREFDIKDENLDLTQLAFMFKSALNYYFEGDVI